MMKKWQKRSLALLLTMLMAVSVCAVGTTAFAANVQAEKPQAVLVSATKTTLAKPAIPTVTNVKSGLKITWKKVSGAAGYQIWRSVDNGKYLLVKAIKSGSTLSYVNDTSAANKYGKKYKFAVRAYKKVNGKTVYSAFSPIRVIYRVATPAAPTLTNVKTGVKVTWKKISGANYYQVWRSADGGKTFTRVKTVKAGTTSITDTAVANKVGKKFVYKVRGYKAVSGKNYCGAFSATKTILKAPGSLEGTAWDVTKIDFYGKIYTSKDLEGFTQRITFNNGTARVYNNGILEGASPYTYKNCKAYSDGLTMQFKGNVMVLNNNEGMIATYKRVS